MDFYTARGLHHFAALLHAKFLRMEAACAVWSQLVQQHQLTMDTQFPGLAYFCQRLADLRDDEEEDEQVIEALAEESEDLESRYVKF